MSNVGVQPLSQIEIGEIGGEVILDLRGIGIRGRVILGRAQPLCGQAQVIACLGLPLATFMALEGGEGFVVVFAGAGFFISFCGAVK